MFQISPFNDIEFGSNNYQYTIQKRTYKAQNILLIYTITAIDFISFLYE